MASINNPLSYRIVNVRSLCSRRWSRLACVLVARDDSTLLTRALEWIFCSTLVVFFPVLSMTALDCCPMDTSSSTHRTDSNFREHPNDPNDRRYVSNVICTFSDIRYGNRLFRSSIHSLRNIYIAHLISSHLIWTEVNWIEPDSGPYPVQVSSIHHIWWDRWDRLEWSEPSFTERYDEHHTG